MKHFKVSPSTISPAMAQQSILQKRIAGKKTSIWGFSLTKNNISSQGSSFGLRNLTKTVNFSSSTWNTIGTHEVFTVTGTVNCFLTVSCSLTLVGGSIQLGVAGNTNQLIQKTSCSDITNGSIWKTFSGVAFIADVVGGGPDTSEIKSFVTDKDIGYELIDAPATAGILVYDLWWNSVSMGSSIIYGIGESL